MRRSRRTDKRREAGGRPPEGGREPDAAEVEVLGGDAVLTAYRVSPVRPWSQMAARIGLWSAVGIGVVGGMLGVLRPPVQQVEAVVEQADADTAVPAPVAGMAELVVQEWLTVDADGNRDEDVLDALFVEPIDGAGSSLGDLLVERVTTVSGQARHEGYWAVTVAADVVESVPVPAGEEGEVEARPSTWFVEVAIVGDAEGALAALTAPAVVPAPPEVTTGWRPSSENPRSADDGPLSTTVQGFLDALLAGDGDPSRYMAPGGEVSAVAPAPFELVELVELSADELSDGRTRVLAEVVATTPGGTTTGLTYEILLEEWADRWEISQFAGAPTLLVGEPPADDTDETGDAGETGDTDDAEGEGSDGSEAEPADGERPADRQTSTSTPG